MADLCSYVYSYLIVSFFYLFQFDFEGNSIVCLSEK